MVVLVDHAGVAAGTVGGDRDNISVTVQWRVVQRADGVGAGARGLCNALIGKWYACMYACKNTCMKRETQNKYGNEV